MTTFLLQCQQINNVSYVFQFCRTMTVYKNYALIVHVIELVVMGSVTGRPSLVLLSRCPAKWPGLYGLTGDRAPADATSGCSVVDWIVETGIRGAGWWSWWWPLGWHAPLPINSYRVDEWATLAGPAMHLSHILQRTAFGQGYIHFCSGVVRCGVWEGCIVGFSRLIYWPITLHFITCSY